MQYFIALKQLSVYTKSCILSLYSHLSAGILLFLSLYGGDATAQCQLHIAASPKGIGCMLSEEEVSWEAPVNVTISGNDLNKTGGNNNWNAGAASINRVMPGGYMYTVASETNTARMIGLSSTNPDVGYISIQYAFYLQGNANLGIYESGNNRGNFGTYATGDTLKILTEAGRIKYYRNGHLLYVRNGAPATPLLVDASLRSPGSTLTDVHVVNPFTGIFEASHPNPGTGPSYSWTLNGSPVGTDSPQYQNTVLLLHDVVTCTITPGAGSCASADHTSNAIRILHSEYRLAEDFYISAQPVATGCMSYVEPVYWQQSAHNQIESIENNLLKIQSNGNWDGGAYSLNEVLNNGYFEFTNSEITRKAIGLSHTNPNAHFNTIQYCFFIESNGNLRIYESGTDRGNFGTYSIGDVFRIEVKNNTVRYLRNGALLRISTVTPTLPLRVDVSLRDVGATVTNPVISNFTEGVFSAQSTNAGPAPEYRWLVNGAPAGPLGITYTNASLNGGDVITCELIADLDGCDGITYPSQAIHINNSIGNTPYNFYISATAVEAACASANEQVVWDRAQLLHNDATGNNLVKTQSNGNWDGGAWSLNEVHNNGYFEFTNSEITRKAVGLSHTNPNAHMNTIGYAFFFEGNGNLRIYENGTDRGNFGTYAPGDVFRIEVDAGAIKYFQNGNILRVSTIAPTFPLHVDVSLRDVDATVTNALITNYNEGNFEAYANHAGASPTYQWKLNGSNVGSNSPVYSNPAIGDGDMVTCVLTPDIPGCASAEIESTPISIQVEDNPSSIDFFIRGNVASAGCYIAIEDAVWNTTSLTNVIASQNNLNKVQSNGNWNGGAASLNSVADNGYFEFVNSEITRKAVGLSHTNADAHMNTIQYAFYFESNGNLRIYESGNNRGNFGTYASGQVFRIAVEAGVVKYYRNGTLLRIAPAAPTLPLLIDVSLRDVGSTVTDAVIANFNGGSFTANAFNAGDNPSFQWKLNGTDVGTDSPVYTNNNLNDLDVITCTLTPDIPGCQSIEYESNEIIIEEFDNPQAINFFISANPSATACNTALEDVVWNTSAIQNVDANGNNLVKVQSNNNWNGGAASLNRVHNNGWFEFTATETNRARMAGLSHTNANSNFNTIQYAIYLQTNGVVRIYENGNNRGTFGNYTTGDKLRIHVDNGVVKYYRNSTLLRIAPAAPTLPLLVDVSIRDVGGTITNAQISNYNAGSFTAYVDDAGPSPSFQWQVNGADVGTNSPSFTDTNLADGDIVTCTLTPDLGGCGLTFYTSNQVVKVGLESLSDITLYAEGVPNMAGFGYAIEEVVWIPSSLTNVEASGSNLLKVFVNNNWNGNAASYNTVKNNGYFEFTATETNRRRMVGLSHTDASTSYITIQYAFDLNTDGSLRIYESGNNRGLFGTYASGDALRIAIEAGSVVYYRNGIVLHTSTVAPTLPLLADVSIRDVGGTVTNAVVANLTGGTFAINVQDAGPSPSYQWKLNGANVGANSPVYTNVNVFDGDVITCEVTPDLPGCATSGFTSNTITISGPQGTTDWIGIVNTNWHNAANWSDGVPNQYISAIIPAGTPFSPFITGTAIAKNFELQAGASFDFTGGTLQIHSDFRSMGTFNAGNGTVAFLGEGDVDITGSTTRFNTLTINKTSPDDRVYLNVPVEIANETIFINGILDANSHQVVYLAGSDSREGLDESHIEGTVSKIGNAEFRFPIGRNGKYAPLRISAPTNITDHFTATYEDNDPNETGHSTTDRPTSLATISSCEYWMLNQTVGSSMVQVWLSYDAVRSCGVADPAELRVSGWNGAEWANYGYLTHTGDAQRGMVASANPIFDYFYFTLASSTSINVLPIELVEFSARPHYDQVMLKWVTATEINSDYYTIERSKDGTNYELLGYKDAAGHSSSTTNYQMPDFSPYKGTSYYRLSQTDFDGTTETFAPVAITVGGESLSILYPNPNSGMFTVALLDLWDEVSVRVLTSNGAVVWTHKPVELLFDVDLSHMPPGIYYLEVSNTSEKEMLRFIML